MVNIFILYVSTLRRERIKMFTIFGDYHFCVLLKYYTATETFLLKVFNFIAYANYTTFDITVHNFLKISVIFNVIDIFRTNVQTLSD